MDKENGKGAEPVSIWGMANPNQEKCPGTPNYRFNPATGDYEPIQPDPEQSTAEPTFSLELQRPE